MSQNSKVQSCTNSHLKNHKPKQPKPQKPEFGLYVFGQFFYSTVRFGYVCGFYFTNQTKHTKPQYKRNIN